MTNDSSPSVTSVDGISTFKETAVQVEVDETVSFPGRHEFDVFRINFDKSLLKRAYLISSFNWNAALATPVTIPLIGALATKPAFAMLKNLFKLVRCKFKLQFKMVSSQYHQGSAMIGYLPCVDWALVPKDLQSLSAYHITVVSACTQESLTIHIPYCSPNYWFDSNTMSGATAEHATVFFCPLNVLLTSNPLIPAVIPMEVYGSIEDCDLSGAISQASSRSKKDIEAEKKERDGKDAAMGSVIRNSSQLIRKIPVVGAVWSPVADVINAIFGTELSKPITVMPPTNVESRYCSDVNQSDGLTQATTISLYQNPRVKVAPVMYGMDTSYKSFRKYAATPMLYDVTLFNGTNTQWSAYVTPIRRGVFRFDYLAMAATNFKYHRGSIKYLIHFIVPCFYSVRIRIRYAVIGTSTNVSDTPNMLLDIKGDVWQAVTVPMNNYVPWNMDYGSAQQLLNQLIIEQVSPIVGPPSPSTAVVYVTIFRAGAEDIQFAWPRSPYGFINWTSEPSVHTDLSYAKAQCNIREKFNETFDPIMVGQNFVEEQNAIMGETVGNMIDCMKRHAKYPQDSGNYISELGSTTNLSTHKFIMSSFMWMRGSVVARHIHRTHISVNNDGFYIPNGSTDAGDPQDGWVPTYATPTPLMQTEAMTCAWTCPAPYVPTPTAKPYILAINKIYGYERPVLNGTIDEVTLAAGDDFVFMYQVPWANELYFPPETRHRKILPKIVGVNNNH